MKIGIVTYVKDDNYGEELQAFATAYFLNKRGYDAEVIDMEKRVKELSASKDTIIPAIVNRFKVYGWKAPYYIYKKFASVRKGAKHHKEDAEFRNAQHQKFVDFFNQHTIHSEKYYTLEEIQTTSDLPYDTYIAGSDQIWNYMHTDFLDVFFLEFAKKFNARRISYAASISVPKIPQSKKEEYRKLLENIQYLSVRESMGAELLEKEFGKKATIAIDPTFLLTKSDWLEAVGSNPLKGENYVVVYTLSGSANIRNLAKNIADKLGSKTIVFMFGMETLINRDGQESKYGTSPSEWVGLMADAKYVVTDSFHGTAFSINFNKPFTTLVNPVSNMNTRVMSILRDLNLESRILMDKGTLQAPETLAVNYDIVNQKVDDWRKRSIDFLINALK